MQPPLILSPDMPKPEAAKAVAAALGIGDFDPYWGPVADLLTEAERRFARPRNAEIGFVSSAPAMQEVTLGPRIDRLLPAPHYLNGRPESFPGFPAAWPSGAAALRAAVLPGGAYCLVGDAPMALAESGEAVAGFSSKYARLCHFYDRPVAAALEQARVVEGTALALIDDVFGLNYCHFICDWLSRLAPFADLLTSSDFHIITAPVTTDWQRRMLALCGLPYERVIQLRPWEAVKARTLITLSDISEIAHPMQKAAPWAVRFLRRTLMAPLQGVSPGTGRKLYISRADAGGRRIRNEDALLGLLEPLGYERVVLGMLDFDAQVALFAEASHVVGIHGAGLTNIIFAPETCRVTEILPRSYGTPAFCVLAAARGQPYATYLADAEPRGDRAQTDDLVVDVADFAAKAVEWL